MAYLKASVLSRLPGHAGGCFAFSEGSAGGMGKWVQGTGEQWNRMAFHSDCWIHDLDLVLCSILWDGSLTSGSFWRVVSVVTLPRESNHPEILFSLSVFG